MVSILAKIVLAFVGLSAVALLAALFFRQSISLSQDPASILKEVAPVVSVWATSGFVALGVIYLACLFWIAKRMPRMALWPRLRSAEQLVEHYPLMKLTFYLSQLALLLAVVFGQVLT